MKTRKFLWLHQKFNCYYCKRLTLYRDWTIDHKQPLSRGGTRHRSNEVGCCNRCNHDKGNMTEEEFKTVHPRDRKKFLRDLNKLRVTVDLAIGVGDSLSVLDSK